MMLAIGAATPALDAMMCLIASDLVGAQCGLSSASCSVLSFTILISLSSKRSATGCLAGISYLLRMRCMHAYALPRPGQGLNSAVGNSIHPARPLPCNEPTACDV